MEFKAAIYFDFGCKDAYRLFRLLALAADAGATIGIDWRSFSLEQHRNVESPPVWETKLTDGRLHAAACAEWVKATHPDLAGMFVAAVFIARYEENVDIGRWDVLEHLGGVVGFDGQSMVAAVRDHDEGYAMVARSHTGAVELGVFGTPSIVRDGPPLYVELNPAAFVGDAVAQLATIDAVLVSDGIWELKKPS